MAIESAQEERAYSADTVFRAKLDFAERCFVNVQELSRFIDQKASYLLSAVALMTAALGIVASRALDSSPTEAWQVGTKILAMVFFAGYVVIAFSVIYNSTQVFRARPPMSGKTSNAPGLIFPLVVLSKFADDEGVQDELYFHKLVNITPHQMLHDYSNQIVEVSTIYAHKQEQINRSLTLFRWLTIFWVIAMVMLLFAILVGKV